VLGTPASGHGFQLRESLRVTQCCADAGAGGWVDATADTVSCDDLLDIHGGRVIGSITGWEAEKISMKLARPDLDG
jgi:hypothetical protein